MRGGEVMPEIHINYLAVLVAAIVNMVIGVLWYSVLFGKKWLSIMKFSEEKLKARKKGVWVVYLASFIGALVMSYVLAHIVDFVQATTVYEGAMSGLWIWIGFIITTSLGGILFEGRPKGLYFLNNGYHFASLIIMGIILAVWV